MKHKPVRTACGLIATVVGIRFLTTRARATEGIQPVVEAQEAVERGICGVLQKKIDRLDVQLQSAMQEDPPNIPKITRLNDLLIKTVAARRTRGVYDG